MSDLPLFKTTQGCENIRLKARVSELEFTIEAISRMAFDAATRCNTDYANIYLKQINEELKVLFHTPKESLLLHDAEVLERLAIEAWHINNFCGSWLQDKAEDLRQQAKGGDV